MAKVMHFASYYNTSPLYGLLVGELSARGYSQSVVSPRGIEKSLEVESVVYFGENLWGKIDRILFRRKIAKYRYLASKVVRDNPPEILHAHSLYSDGFAAYAISLEIGVPYVVTVRSTDIYKFAKYYKYLNGSAREILDGASRVIFLSENYIQKLQEVLGCSLKKTKIEVIPNGIDRYWFQHSPTRIPQREDKLLVVSVGKVIPRKNHETVIRAVLEYNSSGRKSKLKVIGDYESAYGKRLKRKYASESVEFTGAISRSEIRAVLCSSDLFVLLSKIETFGLVYAEALSQGVPVVVSAGQGFDGMCDSSEWYKSLGSDDIDGLIKLFNGQPKLEKPNIDARKFSEKFSWSTVGLKLHKVYSSVI